MNPLKPFAMPAWALVAILFLSTQAMALSVAGTSTIADHTVATEANLRDIPADAIQAAKNSLHIAYFHSSHGSRVITGMEGLRNYKAGDDTLFNFTKDNSPQAGVLDIDDHYSSGNDLSAKDTLTPDADGHLHAKWYHETVTYLDTPANDRINVLMWSWCNPEEHDHQQYIDDMEALIAQYGPGGSKIGVTKTVPVTFVFMTGHPNADGESDLDTSAYHCHTLVTQHCRANNRFCLDYWGIETHDMDDVYHPWANDNGYEDGNYFYLAWQSQHPGEFFETDCIHCDVNQDLTCNRIAYASWWLWARIAGWTPDGQSDDTDTQPDSTTDTANPQAQDLTTAPTGSTAATAEESTPPNSGGSSGCFIGQLR